MYNIAFESDKDIESWIKEYQKPENVERIVLPNVPYSWYELLHEWRRRQDLY